MATSVRCYAGAGARFERWIGSVPASDRDIRGTYFAVSQLSLDFALSPPPPNAVTA